MAALINAAGSAANVAVYVGCGQHWFNAAIAVFCGLMAIICAIDEVA